MAIYKNEPLDLVFHALGDPTRRQMLSMLNSGQQLSATELATPFDMAQPSISKHLKVLEEAGLVTREVTGRTHSFRLNPEQLNEAEVWLERHTRFWAGSLKRLSRYATTHTKKESNK